MADRKAYATDLTDAQWALIEPLMPPRQGRRRGRIRQVDLREVVNAILYLNRTGCGWRHIPHDFPNWSTVSDYYHRFRRDGTWKRIHDLLRDQVREQEGRQPSPSIGIMDSQSVKTTEKGG